MEHNLHYIAYYNKFQLARNSSQTTLLHPLETALWSVADWAFLVGFPSHSKTADLADKVRLILWLLTCLKSFKRFLVQGMMYFLHCVGMSEASQSLLVIISLSLLQKTGIHFGKLVIFTSGGCFQIIRG